MKTSYSFSRRGPDWIAEELATVLSKNGLLEFKPLFLIVHANLKSRNLANGGEEMLRLRVYEKLQNLVDAGIVKKIDKAYEGTPESLKTFLASAAEANARFSAARLPAATALSPADS